MTIPSEVLGAIEPDGYMPERTYWHSSTAQLSDRYDETRPQETRTMVPQDQGELVSSLCTSGLHAPALDIDYPAELERLPVPQSELNMLTVYKGVSFRPYARLLIALAETSLVQPGHARMLIDEAGAHAYPFIVALETPARLVPSSTPGHNHLYLDTELPWDDHERLLKRFEEATIVQRGFYTASVERKQTMLRKPGVRKPERSADLAD